MRTRVALIATAVLALSACGTAGPSGGASPDGSLTGSTGPAAPTASPIAAGPSGQIAFIRPETPDGSGQVDIYVVAASAGGSPRRLTNDARLEQRLFWQLDGSRLVYAWSTHADPYHQTLTSMRPDGSDARDLGPVQTAYTDPAVSPDGRFVVFGGDGTEGGSSGLVLLDLRDGTRTQLTTDGAGDPRWSPDGSRVLAYLPSRRIEVVQASDGAVVARIDDPDVEGVYGWTPDGRSILYQTCGPNLGKFECMAAPPTVANADGTGARPYTGLLPAASDTSLASPNGQFVASWADGRLMVAPSSGGADLQVGAGGPAAWSPDSMWLVFNATSTEPTATSAWLSKGLFAVRRDGGKPIQLTDGAGDQAMAWGP